MLRTGALGGRCRYRRGGAGDRSLVGAHALGRPLPRAAHVPRRRCCAPEPAVGWPRVQHLSGDAVNIGWKLAAVLQGGHRRCSTPTRSSAARSPNAQLPQPQIRKRFSRRPSRPPTSTQTTTRASSCALSSRASPRGQAQRVPQPWPRARLRLPRLICRRCRTASRSQNRARHLRPVSASGRAVAARVAARRQFDLRPPGWGFTVLRLSPHGDATPLLDAAQRQSVPLTLLDLSSHRLRQSYGADLLDPTRSTHRGADRGEDPEVLVTRVIASRPTEEER